MTDNLPENFRMMKTRFRGFLPVVVDVETGGFNADTDALLEIAAVPIGMDSDGRLQTQESVYYQIEPFPGANIEPESLKFIRHDLDHPLRVAVKECDALGHLFAHIREAKKAADCTRAVLVGHNAAFDLGFLNAAVVRNNIKRNPFHLFTTFDTACLSALMFGQTVLSRAVTCAGIEFNGDDAHSALYDAEKTAELFCYIVNKYHDLI